jgi:hypothetical protein
MNRVKACLGRTHGDRRGLPGDEDQVLGVPAMNEASAPAEPRSTNERN